MDSTENKVEAIASKENGNGHHETPEIEQIDLEDNGVDLTEQEKLLLEEKVKRYLLAEKKKRQAEEAEYIEEQKKKLKEEEKLYVSSQSILAAGAIGGVGSVCIKLIGEENLKNEITQTSTVQDEQVDLLSFDLSQVSLGLGLEFILYSVMSIFLGALSSFILISMGGISTHINSRRRCLASAILFGLFFPSSIQVMKQNFDSQITIENQQKEVQELKVKEVELSEKNAALTVESKEAIATLTQTEDVQEKPELKQKVLDGYIDIFRNVEEVPKQQELLTNIADVGEGNIVPNTEITQDAVDFLEFVAVDEQYETSVKNIAERRVTDIRAKCELEEIDCG